MSMGMEEVKKLLGNATVGELIELALKQKQAGERGGEPTDGAVFRKEGETWVLRFAGQTIYARQRIGLEYITYLLANPSRSVPVMSLYLAVAGRPPSTTPKHGWWQPGSDDGSCGWQTSDSATTEVLADDSAVRDCERRLREIEQETERAEAANDEAAATALKNEREQIQGYLGSCRGPNGRLRKVADVREKVRKSVSNAMARAVSAIIKQHEPLGRHLRNCIRTGYDVSYDPEAPVGWQL